MRFRTGPCTRARSSRSRARPPSSRSSPTSRQCRANVDAQRGYRALRVEGPLPLDLIGIFAAIAAPLAAAQVPIFPIATYDTDYVLVADSHFERAVRALEVAGHSINAG